MSVYGITSFASALRCLKIIFVIRVPPVIFWSYFFPQVGYLSIFSSIATWTAEFFYEESGVDSRTVVFRQITPQIPNSTVLTASLTTQMWVESVNINPWGTKYQDSKHQNLSLSPLSLFVVPLVPSNPCSIPQPQYDYWLCSIHLLIIHFSM